MGEGIQDTAFGFGLAEGRWGFLWVYGMGWAFRQESAILPDCTAFE